RRPEHPRRGLSPPTADGGRRRAEDHVRGRGPRRRRRVPRLRPGPRALPEPSLNPIERRSGITGSARRKSYVKAPHGRISLREDSMAEFKAVIADPKSGKAYKKDITGHYANALIGKKIGEDLDGLYVGLPGYKLQITGGSDKDGFPMRSDLPGAPQGRTDGPTQRGDQTGHLDPPRVCGHGDLQVSEGRGARGLSEHGDLQDPQHQGGAAAHRVVRRLAGPRDPDGDDAQRCRD